MAERKDIVYIGEHQDDAALVELSIQRDLPGVRVIPVVDAGGFASQLLVDAPIAFLLAQSPPWANGLELIAPLRRRHPFVPIVMMAKTADAESATLGMCRGLSHYLETTPRNLLRLPHLLKELIRQKPADSGSETKRLVEQSGLAYLRTNADGRILDSNGAFQRLIGEVPPREASIYEYSTDAREWGDLLRAVRSGGIVREAIVKFRSSLATPIHARVSASTALAGDGEKVVDLMLEDVSERLRLELELRRRVESLEAANADLERFTSMASHELKEPLRTLERYTRLLDDEARDKLSASSGECMEFILQGTRRMQGLVDDLLGYSKVLTHEPNLEPVESYGLLRQALANVAAAVEECEARVTSDPLPTVNVDPWQVVSLFQNLVGNAVKFRSGKRPQIHISARREDREWIFSVRDNGLGIASADRQRIFEIFQRLHSKDEIPGTGVGLATCRRIVERHGGRIWVESDPGVGSTFFFTLPATATPEKIESERTLSAS